MSTRPEGRPSRGRLEDFMDRMLLMRSFVTVTQLGSFSGPPEP
ncbi:hypothetical protein [Streptomyces sp. NBC_00038]|nr:hypothetical protein [Streptomyces sp. NBC_00038]MCX5563555.1 hypothetical protein [Streptomyces sp. NBC_00038]